MSKRRKASKRNELYDITEALVLNGKAMEEGPRRKTWTMHDLRQIKPLTPAQEEMFHDFIMGKNICAHGSAGTGKAQPLHSKILTPKGWKFMGDIVVGDKVLTPKNTSATVIGVFSQGKKDIFTITFSDGATAQACAEHLWKCHVPSDFWNTKDSTEKIVNTEFLSVWLDEKTTRNSPANISIDLVNAIEQPTQYLLIDPYLLGVLLGDGHISQSTPKLSSADRHIVETIQTILQKEEYSLKQSTGTYDYNIVNLTHYRDGIYQRGGRKKTNNYTDKLKELALYGKRSHEKFIPKSYKEGSIEQRLELLRGLMDTDGTVSKRNGGVSFTTTSPHLACDVQEILWSLGAKCSIKTRQPTYTYKDERKIGRVAYTLFISYPKPKELFSLPRKRDLCHDTYQQKQLCRQVISVELTSQEEAQCIMIDDQDHLYITDDYVITHNTFVGLWLALNELLRKDSGIDRIIIVRSAVPSREQGFLPGTLEEKSGVYETPYRDMFHNFFGKYSTYDDMKAAGLVEFCTTSYLRGLTWDNAVVVVDEGQNMRWDEINTIMTRVGKYTRVIFVGDVPQTDLRSSHDKSGMGDFLRVLPHLPSFNTIRFTHHDIVRSEFVKQWIIASESLR